MVLLLIVSVPLFEMPPPPTPAILPLRMVSPERTTVA
jgi:hypothetical protein